jgi:hypothetical protein
MMTSTNFNIRFVNHPRPPASPATATLLPGGAVVCDACGCRVSDDGEGLFRHYPGAPGRDARGCRVACADQDHRIRD